jgi:hypothetical protein
VKTPGKQWRVLIGEAQQAQALDIERAFNQLGYYRVMPLRSFAQVLNVLDYSPEPIDLLLINRNLFDGATSELYEFCSEHRQINHALIYDVRTVPLLLPRLSSKGVQAVLPYKPDAESLGCLMAMIESHRLPA